MKKVYFMALALFFGIASMAQVSVTFQVDMNNETVSPNGVHVAGNWQDDAGFPGEWDPSTSEMTDDDEDGIYTLTVSVPAGEYEYKFINDNAWGADEAVPLPNQRGAGNSNRVFSVTQWHADNGGLTLPAYVFGGSAPAGQVAVRLMIDMSNQEVSELGVHVAGNFSDPQWTPQLSKAWEVQNGKYAFVGNVDPEASYQYKFLNGDFWGDDEAVPGDCAVDGNRGVDVGTEDVITDAYCFGTCGLCAPQTEVTFELDLSGEGGGNPDGVSVAGSFQGWSPGVNLLTDDDGDMIYTGTFSLDQGTYEYKFINGVAWGDDESVPGECNVNGNRELVVGDEPVTAAFCFGQCSAECIPDPDPAEITFQVNMNEEEVSAEGVFMIGGFTDPAWQGGATPMTDDDGDGIFTATVLVDGPAEIQYKYVNGDVNVSANEENANLDSLGCGIPNGIGGFNRTHTRSGEAETLPPYYFNSCSTILSVEEAELGRVAIYPNPSEGVSFIEIENPRNHTLRMHIVDITGKVVSENEVINSTRYEINTTELNSGLYFLNIVNERNQRAVYKLMVK
jgi:hypothetical protein